VGRYRGVLFLLAGVGLCRFSEIATATSLDNAYALYTSKHLAVTEETSMW